MKWLTQDIATASFNEFNNVALDSGARIIDVRDLVDKAGNDIKYINAKIEESLNQLKQGFKIIVCCDYGMSRSNSIAIGVIVKWLNVSFGEAVGIAKKVVDESGVKIEMLNTVYTALYKRPGDILKRKIKNICITGAGGFLGKNLVEELESKFKLICPSSKEVNLVENIIELDLLVKSNEVDSIVHLANPKVFTNTRSIGDTLIMLKNVLDVCRTNDTKLVYLSGWEIYSGYKSKFLLADEYLQANPKGTYGETKWLCELLIKQYAANYGIKYQIVRSGPVYGVGAEKPKFIYNFIDKAYGNKKIVTHKYLNGVPALDLLYIDDLVSFLTVSVASDYVGDINIGSGSLTSTFEVATQICNLIGSSSIIESVEIADYSANIVMNYSLANKMFSWKPATKVEDGLSRILENYNNE